MILNLWLQKNFEQPTLQNILIRIIQGNQRILQKVFLLICVLQNTRMVANLQQDLPKNRFCLSLHP